MQSFLKARSVAAALVAASCALFAVEADAQSAFRCDDAGKVVYSDKPCPQGRAVAPAQDSPEQRAASKAATDQLRKDQADLNKRLSEREKLEAQERAAANKAAAKRTPDAAKKEKKPSAKSTKAKSAKIAKKSKSRAKLKPVDNRSRSSSK
jgi:hypothetical protein